MNPVITTKACLLTASFILLPGCLGDTSSDPLSPAARPPAPLLPANDTLPGAELDLQPAYAVSGAGLMYGDLQGGAAEVKVPSGANNTTVLATWTPRLPTSARQNCMIHTGSKQAMGPMIAGRSGASPLMVPNTTIPAGTSSLVVMCLVDGSPAGAEAFQPINVMVSFFRR